MEYIQGVTLQAIWTSPNLSSTRKHAIVKQVAAYIDQLWLLELPQKGVVASAGLGQCLDYYVGVTTRLSCRDTRCSIPWGRVCLWGCSEAPSSCCQGRIGSIASRMKKQIAYIWELYWQLEETQQTTRVGTGWIAVKLRDWGPRMYSGILIWMNCLPLSIEVKPTFLYYCTHNPPISTHARWCIAGGNIAVTVYYK